MRTMIVAYLFTAVVCAASPSLIPEDKPARHVIIFYDISRSVADDEEKAAEDFLVPIFGLTPAGTRVIIIPICANTDGAPSIPWTVDTLRGITPQKKQEDAEKRKKKLEDVLAKIRGLRSTATAKSHYSSCVSPALSRVLAMVSTPEEASLTDVLFISDMIEECADSLLGKPTSMLGSQFNEAYALVNGKSTLLDLPRGLHVYVLKPRAWTTTVPNPHHPPGQKLKLFWEQLFSRCGIRRDQLKWDADIDRYLDALNQD